MYAEYLLSGQRARVGTGLSLGELATRYGVRPEQHEGKRPEVPALWAKGVETCDIPYQVLRAYLTQDLALTLGIYRAQLARGLAQGQLRIIRARMEMVLCATEMEWNGLRLDLPEAQRQGRMLKKEVEAQQWALQARVPREVPEGLDFNWGSSTLLSAVYFGGQVKLKMKDKPMWRRAGDYLRARGFPGSSPRAAAYDLFRLLLWGGGSEPWIYDPETQEKLTWETVLNLPKKEILLWLSLAEREDGVRALKRLEGREHFFCWAVHLFGAAPPATPRSGKIFWDLLVAQLSDASSTQMLNPATPVQRLLVQLGESIGTAQDCFEYPFPPTRSSYEVQFPGLLPRYFPGSEVQTCFFTSASNSRGAAQCKS